MRDVTLIPLFSFAYELTNLNSIVWFEKKREISPSPVGRTWNLLTNENSGKLVNTFCSKKAEAVDVVSAMFSNPPEDARLSFPQQRLSHRSQIIFR